MLTFWGASNASYHRVQSVLNIAHCVQEAHQALFAGDVIAVPTDTIYGIASALGSVGKLYDIKGRDHAKPIAVCVGDPRDVSKVAKLTASTSLLQELLPGPVTLVFRRNESLPLCLNPFTDLVGVRVPDHEFIRQLCRSFGPIALTSANLSNTRSCLNVEEFQCLWPKIGLIIDGNQLSETEQSRSGSTVIDLSISGTYRIIRPGR
ncbi:unnamed protein product [Soboliphyme baturini]|uniref:Threonylcarbamoyl-AMP synthase n=1 Tax=Soboliphyme baturini TaxID=241478 RepID=A0A183ITY0_9BILA|nr:unnamed protein product [Soboliphyme baturini]